MDSIYYVVGLGAFIVLYIIINAIQKVIEFLSNAFKTNESCVQCQQKCRKEIYDKIEKKADNEALRELQRAFNDLKNSNTEILKSVTGLDAKVNIILSSSFKNFRDDENR